MHAQLTYFEGPRSPELVTAADRASKERIIPAILARPELRNDLVGLYQLRRPDGGEITVVLVEHYDTLDKARDVIMSTALLPGEDPALLPGPDRSERYRVVYTLAGQSNAADAGLAVR